MTTLPGRIGLLVVDHGSRRAGSNAQLADMAARVARLRPDCLVGHAHMEIAQPDIPTACADLAAQGASDITILLYFLSDGRHVSEDIPALAATAASRLGLPVRVGASLGPHDLLARLLLERGGVPGPLAT